MNGGGTAPFADYGFHQLFRNAGNQNNWIEIDLIGLISNRDAIGAEIFANTKGVTQKRRQTGQMHYYSQDYKRIHFGLASNQTIDELKIIWPDSQIQNLLNVASNRIIKVYEPSADMDRDNDVDGKDLHAYIQILQENTYAMTIADFSNNFGK